MELKYLQTFHTILKTGSFGKAAQELGYTQSTITFQVQQLEQSLGVQLFERIGRRMVPTEAARHATPHVQAVLDAAEQLEHFSGAPNPLQGELRVAVAETQLCFVLPPLIAQFHAMAPQARLRLQSMNCCDIRDALLDGSVDLGVFYREVGGLGTCVHTEVMGSYPIGLLSAPETRAQFPDFVTPNQRLALPLLAGEPSCMFRQSITDYLRQKQIVLDQTMELRSIPTVKNLVCSGLGVAYLPLFTAQQELESGTLCQIETDLAGDSATCVCGWHKNKWQSPLMSLFLSLAIPAEEPAPALHA